MKNLQNIFFLIFSVFTYGQVTLLTDVNIKDAKPNEPIILTIVQEVAGENMEQQTPLRLPDLSKFDIIGTASEQNTFIDQKKGLRINQFVYQYYLMPKVSGKVKIGSALLTVNGKIYKSEPFDINVREALKNTESENLAKDVILNLEVSDKIVYENQPTVAVLRAYSKNFDNFRKIENIKISEQSSAIVKPISYKKQDIETEEDGEYSSQIIATFVIFPEKSGHIEIEPVSAFIKNTDNNKVISNKVKINVKTLPDGSPKNFKNTVGDFDVSIETLDAPNQIEINKPINVLVKIAGNGNLDASKLPKIIKSDEYSFFKPKITTKLKTNENGVKGVIAANYILIPKKLGEINIHLEDFSYFNPITNKYFDLGKKSVKIDVLSSQQISEQKSALDVVDDYTKNVIETVPLPVLEKTSAHHFYTFNWKNIFLNLALISSAVFLFYAWASRKRKNQYLAKSPVANYSTIAEEEEKIRNNSKPDFYLYYDFLKKLKNSNNFSEFFKTYEELHTDVEKYIENYYKMSLKNYLQTNNGRQFFEEFKDLEKLMSIEKYAPIHDQDHIEELYESIVKIYSQIVN